LGRRMRKARLGGQVVEHALSRVYVEDARRRTSRPNQSWATHSVRAPSFAGRTKTSGLADAALVSATRIGSDLRFFLKVCPSPIGRRPQRDVLAHQPKSGLNDSNAAALAENHDGSAFGHWPTSPPDTGASRWSQPSALIHLRRTSGWRITGARIELMSTRSYTLRPEAMPEPRTENASTSGRLSGNMRKMISGALRHRAAVGQTV